MTILDVVRSTNVCDHPVKHHIWRFLDRTKVLQFTQPWPTTTVTVVVGLGSWQDLGSRKVRQRKQSFVVSEPTDLRQNKRNRSCWLRTYKRSSQNSFSPEPTKGGKRKDENRMFIVVKGWKIGRDYYLPQPSCRQKTLFTKRFYDSYGRQHNMRSASQRKLVDRSAFTSEVLNSFRRRRFAVAGPST